MEFIELLKLKNIRFIKDGDRIIVYDDVNLSHTQIKELPKCSIVFFGDVYLNHTQIKKLPKCSIVFLRDVYLCNTQIKKLPDNIIINGYLDISHTPIKELPVCIVKGYLNIRKTSITKIPKNLVASRIYTPFKGGLDTYIEKTGIIGIFWKEKSIDEWIEIFKERKLCDYFHILTPEEYDIVEQDFKTAVKLLESWNS